MTQRAVSIEALGLAAQELFLMVPKELLTDVSALRIRSEVGDGQGSIDMYVLNRDGGVRHLLHERELLQTVFKKLHSLPSKLVGKPSEWAVAVLRWNLGGIANLSLTEESIADRAKTGDRRSDWEKTEFAEREIERVDLPE